jgi:hypothetical protein
MRIFDCFTFYNEFDLLDLRLEELWDTVDYFVIGEANTTHQNNPKSFNLRDNWKRYEKYYSKIRYVMIDDMPMSSDTWVNENFQRYALGRGLWDLNPNDIICVSDCDEIPRPSTLNFIKNDPENFDRYILGMPLFYFKFNYMMINPVVKQINIKVTKGKVFQNAHWERSSFNYIPGVKELDHGGWHFTYLGNTEFAKNKIRNFAHAETNVPEIVDYINVEQMIQEKVGLGWHRTNEKFDYVKLDDYFPMAIYNNKEKYKHLIIDNAEKTVHDYYPR